MRSRLALTLLVSAALVPATLVPHARAAKPAGGRAMTPSIHDFTVRGIDGKPVSLAQYKGKVLLVVNTASRCGFTPQYKSLEALYERYRDKGLVVLGFPANNFMNQEPGSDEEIAKFCSLTYDVSFPMFSKVSVKGRDIAPLYAWLTKDSGHAGDIEWNFAKFLVGPDGRVVARFSPRTDPLSKDVVDRVEALVASK
jgi:glutathione peroxidase